MSQPIVMEMEPSPPMVAKKLWNMVRVVFFMIRRGICKSKIMEDLHLMLKRGKLASKAIADNLTLHDHFSALSCRSGDSLAFISPSARDYEFSCSNSPAYHHRPSAIFHFNKRNKHHHHDNDVTTAAALQKVLEMLNNHDNMAPPVEESPLVTLPGFGRSPTVRQLRVTDSPFPLKEDGDDHNGQVDKAAEEFIKNFYKDLTLQKRKTAAGLDSPYRDTMWGR